MQSAALKAVLSAVDNLSPVLKNINFHTKVLRRQLNSLGRISSNVITTMGKPLALVGGAAGIGGLALGAKGVMGITSKFETLQMTLDRLMGSQEKGKQAMDWVTEFAVKTPYQLLDVAEAFKDVKSLGIDPTKGALKSLGDAAAFWGQPISAASEVMSSALRGNTEMLDNLGIQAKIVGEKMALMWTDSAGKAWGTLVGKNDRGALARSIVAIWNKNYGGMMDMLSNTYEGKLSNLSDLWEGFLRSIGKAGVFDYAKGQITNLLEAFDRLGKDGSLQTWASKISTLMIGVLKRFENYFRGFDPDRFLNFLDELGDGLERVLQYLKDFGKKDFWGSLGLAALNAPSVAISTMAGKLFGTTPPTENKALPADIMALADKYANLYKIPPDLLKGLIQAESGGKALALSSKGAMGVMQLMPDTAKYLGVRNPYDPEQNIAGGTRHLAYLLNRYAGDQAKALAAYNAGENAVDRFKGIPPFPETQNYVRKILGSLPRNLPNLQGMEMPGVKQLLELTPKSENPSNPVKQSPLLDGKSYIDKILGVKSGLIGLDINFNNAPTGMRPEPVRVSNGLNIEPSVNVGYRSLGFAN